MFHISAWNLWSLSTIVLDGGGGGIVANPFHLNDFPKQRNEVGLYTYIYFVFRVHLLRLLRKEM